MKSASDQPEDEVIATALGASWKYAAAADVVPRLDPESYATAAGAELQALLESEEPEAEYQGWLEQHPTFVPGAGGGHHGPIHDVLISQPPLPGLGSKIPDFMWLTKTSAEVVATLIEIEKPSKNLFTEAKQPRQEFTQAQNQITQWRSWSSTDANRTLFSRLYRLGEWPSRGLDIKFEYILVYGRRSEFSQDPKATRHRAALFAGLNDDTTVMSWDRLRPSETYQQVLTIKVSEDSEAFNCVAVSPLLQVGPSNAAQLAAIDRKEDGLDASSPLLTEARRAFLRERFEYAETYVAGEGKAVSVHPHAQ